MPHRSMEHLRREQLSPAAIQEGGRGKVALYDFNALGFFAATGAIMKVSSSITFAARLAKALIDELVSIHGKVPFGRAEFDRLIAEKKLITDDLFDADGEVIPLAVIETIRDNPQLYTQGQILDSDYKILIINGRYVLSGSSRNIRILDGIKLDGKWWLPELVLNPASRGADVTVIPLSEFMDGDNSQIKIKFEDVYKRAETIVEINLSLPIRNALNAICDIRREATAKK